MAKKVDVNLDFGGAAKITNLPAPSAPAEAATKAYVDTAVAGGGGGSSVSPLMGWFV